MRDKPTRVQRDYPRAFLPSQRDDARRTHTVSRPSDWSTLPRILAEPSPRDDPARCDAWTRHSLATFLATPRPTNAQRRVIASRNASIPRQRIATSHRDPTSPGAHPFRCDKPTPPLLRPSPRDMSGPSLPIRPSRLPPRSRSESTATTPVLAITSPCDGSSPRWPRRPFKSIRYLPGHGDDPIHAAPTRLSSQRQGIRIRSRPVLFRATPLRDPCPGDTSPRSLPPRHAANTPDITSSSRLPYATASRSSRSDFPTRDHAPPARLFYPRRVISDATTEASSRPHDPTPCDFPRRVTPNPRDDAGLRLDFSVRQTQPAQSSTTG